MRDKIYSIVFSAIFIILLIWCPIAFILDKLDIVAIPENKNIKMPEKNYKGDNPVASFLNSLEEGKASLENIYSNCLPMYENITMLMFDSERAMNDFLLETLYSFEESNAPPKITVAENPGDTADPGENNSEETTEPPPPLPTYRARRIGTDWQNKVWAFTEEGKQFSEGWTDKTLLADEAELRRRVHMQTDHINRIAKANPDVNFYVYVCSRFQETEIFGEIIKDIRIMANEFSTYHLMMEFFERLDMNAVTRWDYFKIDPLDLRRERILLTDHHESAHGAYNIYSDILNMMAEDSPVLGSPREVTWHVIDGLELRGSHVWNHGYSEIADQWWYYKADLPSDRLLFEQHGQRGPGVGSATRNNMENYEAGRIPDRRNPFADHYFHFWPRIDYAHYPSNNTGRNLMMITDSYSWAVSELLTSHFDRSFTAPFPSFREHWSINYNDFIRENNITDVVVFHVGDRILFDIQDDVQFNRIITD